MIRSIKFKPVNWVDGMRLSSAQFVNNDQYYQDKIRDAASSTLTPYTYGLLGHMGEGIQSFDIQISVKSTHTVHIAIRYCHALTAAGHRIHIEPDQNGKARIATDIVLPQPDLGMFQNYRLLLCVDLFGRSPHGELDAAVDPPRYPLVEPKYIIIMVPESDYISNGYVDGSLPIGRLLVDGAGLRTDPQFLPPCMAIASHPLLRMYYTKFVEWTYQLQESAFTILGKTDMDAAVTPLGKSLRLVTQHLVGFLAGNMYQLKHQYYVAAPVELIGVYANAALQLLSAMRCLPRKDRDDLLKYIYEWRDINPASFEELLT